MQSIKDTVSNEIIIKKSRFIGIVEPIRKEEDIATIHQKYKDKYPDANHHCLAAVYDKTGSIQRFDDDGEPSQTAGMPMLNVLQKQGLTNVCAVVIRYFGGIKLGAGGLVRAYSKAVGEALLNAKKTARTLLIKASIHASYADAAKLDRLLENTVHVLDKVYTDTVTFTIELEASTFENLKNGVQEITAGRSETTILKEYETYR